MSSTRPRKPASGRFCRLAGTATSDREDRAGTLSAGCPARHDPGGGGRGGGLRQRHLPLVASSALAALSLACQAHIDAKRTGKTAWACRAVHAGDCRFRRAEIDLRRLLYQDPIEYEEEQAEAAKPALKDHRAAIEAWEAKRNGIKEKIRQLARKQSDGGMESALRDLEHAKPEPPRIPRLLYTDATPRRWPMRLAKQWPVGGSGIAEAGIVLRLARHGQGFNHAEFGLLNQLWDGKSLTIDRRSTESFTVRGARLTVALQVQEPTLREFFTRPGRWRGVQASLPASLWRGRNRPKGCAFTRTTRRAEYMAAPGGIPSAHCRDSGINRPD
jgi:hypothetical protein